jgi:NAD(P)-dependent dehydrogenase (short-subunit alcohol dehydrogenase family)
MIDLTGHTALVTGGTQGVGASIARSLARAGANVVLHGLKQDSLAMETLRECQSLAPRSTLICCDLGSDWRTVETSLVQPVLDQFPNIDLLVNNAGIFIDKPFVDMDESTYDRTMHLNLKVGYFLTQAFAKVWIPNRIAGRVLFTGSINGLLAEPDHTAYDASKAGVAGLVRSLCIALAPHGIRVNSMAPGLVRTPLTNQVLSRDPAALKWMEWHTPNGQVPESDACGPMAAFLLSDLAMHLHGQTVYVDGGMSAWQQPDPPEAFRNWLASQSSEP